MSGRRIPFLCVWALLCAPAALRALPCTANLTAGDDIQAAIDAAAPGDVICLEAGLYTPASKIHVDKSLVLQGPRFGEDPRPGAGTSRVPGDTATEAVIDGGPSALSGIIVIEADDVVLDGLDVRNGSGDLIDSESSPAISGVVIRYSIVHDASGDEGMQIRACTDCLIERNHVFDVAQDAINMCCGSLRGVIQFNEVHDSDSENAAIYIYDAEEIDVLDNLVYNTTDNDGIKMGGSGCRGDEAPYGSIQRNVVHDTIQDGISVYSRGTLVRDNEIYNSTSENGALYISCSWTTDVTVSGNAIRQNGPSVLGGTVTYGVRIGKGGSLPVTSSVFINGNCIEGNEEGLGNFVLETVDATANWWNDPSGPSGQGPGSGDSVWGDVDYSAWLMSRPLCGPEIALAIDLRPGRDSNQVNTAAKMQVPIAVLGMEGLDPASEVDLDSVDVRGAAPSQTKFDVEDVNGDGYDDLVLYFRARDFRKPTAEECGDPDATILLTASTSEGRHVTGTDSVTWLGPDCK